MEFLIFLKYQEISLKKIFWKMSAQNSWWHFWFYFFRFWWPLWKRQDFANSCVATSWIQEVGVSFPLPAGKPRWFSSTASTERLLGANNIWLPPKIFHIGRVNNPLALPAEGTKMPSWRVQLIFGHPKLFLDIQRDACQSGKPKELDSMSKTWTKSCNIKFTLYFHLQNWIKNT